MYGKNGIDGLLAIFRGAYNLEFFFDGLAHCCDHLLMVISEHHGRSRNELFTQIG